MAFFSVIIPLYNKQDHIENTLNSILRQTFTDYEIVIANDGSTDGSLEKIAAFSDPRIRVFTTENRGVSAARNHAMRQAEGSYFAFMDADDYWYPQHLEKLSDTIATLGHLNVFTTLQEIETTNGIHPAIYSNLPQTTFQEIDVFACSLNWSILSGSSSAIHKSVPDTIGFFNEQITNGEDTEYWIRIGFRYKAGLYNGITSRYNHVNDGLSKKKFNMDRFCDFEQFSEMEKRNPLAKKVIDFNRFSLAIRCTIHQDSTNYNRLVARIDKRNLTGKQRFLLRLPAWALMRLFRFKDYLERKNIRLSVF